MNDLVPSNSRRRMIYIFCTFYILLNHVWYAVAALLFLLSTLIVRCLVLRLLLPSSERASVLSFYSHAVATSM